MCILLNMIMGENYKFGNTSVQWRTYAVGKFPFHNDYTSEKIRCLCALFHSCKQCSLDQTAGSGFTIVSQSPFLFERINNDFKHASLNHNVLITSDKGYIT